jgi:small subunit ribosomal protein S18
MARKKASRKKLVQRPIATDCHFCDSSTLPDYKNYRMLIKYISDRAKIMGKKRTGVCSKHQRKLGMEIKRARHLGLLPFSPRI